MTMFRQGDILLRRIEVPTKRGKRQPPDGDRVVLAYGKATGHAHALRAVAAALWIEGQRRLLEVTAPTAFLDHEEHGAIPLERGWYEVIRQREWEIGDVAD